MNSKPIYGMGIDVGSLASKAMILDQAKNTMASEIIRSEHDSARMAVKVTEKCLEIAGLKYEDIAYVLATGYGRVNVPFADRTITEITCHSRGVHHIFPGARTIVDVGGQDSKAIAVDDKGSVLQFVLNDKCAAGTGRFLEVMAVALDIPLDEMGKQAVAAKERPHISSICTVFAESEIIGMMVQGTPKDWIIAGLCNSVALRLHGMLMRIRLEDQFVMTGGVAKNIGVVQMLGEKINHQFITPPEPQLTGALGAAITALDSAARGDERKPAALFLSMLKA